MLLTGSASAQSPAIPDTPAGHALQMWLDAFNSGDRARMQAYLTKYEPNKPLDPQAAFREQTGGFDLLAIDQNDRLHIQFRVKEKNSPTNGLGRIELQADEGQVTLFALRAIPPGMSAADMNPKIDAPARSRVIDGAIAMLNEFYVYPDIAKKMEAALRDEQKKGVYDAFANGESFAAALTDHLQAVSHDKHLRVNFSPMVLPKAPPGPPTPEMEAQMRAQMERTNCAFEKVEHLQPNIGYVKFNAFADPAICGPTVTAAMNFVANVDAIIFDLRDNGGGDPRMVTFIASYLFNQPTHLNDLYNRKEDSTTQYWTLPYVPGKRLAGKPAFVLTSSRTFSGGEEFTYNLKNLKRATIIGETTGGGAHPVAGHPIDDHFLIGVPFARAINPISKTNWEGTGVEPDVKVPAAEALDVAKKMALDEIRKNAPQKK
jgi:Peptidase family S41/N-terminal domain of Peptidase_S41 in eukaryotic IRBP